MIIAAAYVRVSTDEQTDYSPAAQLLRAAYENHMIDDEAVWLKMLSSRNSSSHIYDDRVAAAIAKDIATSFLPVLKKLSDYYKEI